MTTESIITLALAVLALSLKPGANMVTIMSRVLSQGMPACFFFMLGCDVVLFSFLLMVLVGFQVVDVDILFFSILLKSFGALYLLWLGFKGFQDLNEKLVFKKADPKSAWENFVSGFLITASNPFVILFYAGIFPGLFTMNALTLSDITLVVLIVLSIETIIPILYSLPLALFRYKMPDNFLMGLKIFSSVMMIIIGLYIGYTALPAKDITSVF